MPISQSLSRDGWRGRGRTSRVERRGVGLSDVVRTCACLLPLDLRSMKDAGLLWKQGNIWMLLQVQKVVLLQDEEGRWCSSSTQVNHAGLCCSLF